ncbi:MAG: ADOP family duplicated permease [Vicinamibacterales bacterium]
MAVRRWWQRLLNAAAPGRAEDELRREIDAHLALLADDLEARGLTAHEARLEARRRFGSVEGTRGLHRDTRSVPALDDARQDLAATVRLALRRPQSTLFAVVLMAFAVGATTTLFSLVYGVVFRPLPWTEPDRLVRLEETRGGQRGRVPWTLTNAAYLAWRSDHRTVDEIGGWFQGGPRTLAIDGAEADRVPVSAITPSLLTVLAARPALGRGFVDADALPGAVPTLLLSHGLWQRAFGGRADVIGRQVRLDGQPRTVVGVMPGTFAVPDHRAQAWTPLHVPPVPGEGGVRRVMIFAAMARLRPGVAPAQAAAEATARVRHAPDLRQAGLALFGADGEAAIAAEPARDVLTREVRPGLLLLLAGVGLLFVAAVASTANVQLARAAERRRESAVRAALGASASRLARQWMVESVWMGAVGTAAGLALAAAVHTVLPRWLPDDFPRLVDIRLDWRVATLASLVTGLASMACGLVPAWVASRDRIVAVLGEDSLAPVGGSARTLASRLRAALMTAQVAIACVLLVVTALLARSAAHLFAADRGYDPRHVLTARLVLPADVSAERRAAFARTLHEALAGAPGVTHAGLGTALPLVASGGFRGITMPSPLDPARTIDVQTAVRAVTADYAAALGLRLRSGRHVADTDTPQSPPVVVVNQAFATQYLGGTGVGRRMALGVNGHEEWEVVGVVDNVRQGGFSAAPSDTAGLYDPPVPELYFPFAQWTDAMPEVLAVVRTVDDPATAVPALRAAARAADPSVVVDAIAAMDDRLAAALAMPRLYAAVLAGLAAVALVVAGTGLFGVLAHATTRRTREIGVRTALGASPREIAALVAAQAATSVAAGTALGLLAAAAIAGSLGAQLYGVSPLDAWSFVAAGFGVAAVGVVAALVPVARALRLDPLAALRAS